MIGRCRGLSYSYERSIAPSRTFPVSSELQLGLAGKLGKTRVYDGKARGVWVIRILIIVFNNV